MFSEFRCDRTDFILANTLLIMRWIGGLMVFAAIITAWVHNSNYSNVILGIFNLFALIILALADIPFVRTVAPIRRTVYGLCTGNFLRMSLFLGFITLATPRSQGEFALLPTPQGAAAYLIAASVIMAVISAVHFLAWAFFFRLNGDPEVHWIDLAAPATTAATTTSGAPAAGGTVPAGTAAPVVVTSGVAGNAPVVVGAGGLTPADNSAFREVPLQDAYTGPTSVAIPMPVAATAQPVISPTTQMYGPTAYPEATAPAAVVYTSSPQAGADTGRAAY